MLISDLCDFSDAYIVVKETITVAKKTFDDFMDLAENKRAASATTSNTANVALVGNTSNVALVGNTSNVALVGKLAFKNNAPFFNCISK